MTGRSGQARVATRADLAAAASPVCSDAVTLLLTVGIRVGAGAG
jgi:hypothetical protein